MRPSAQMFTDDLTIITPGTRSLRAGDDVPDWGEDAITMVTVRGRISQRRRDEDNAQRSAQISEWVCYLPAGTAVNGRCRVAHAGHTFEVVGPPYEPTILHGPTHLELTLKLVEG